MNRALPAAGPQAGGGGAPLLAEYGEAQDYPERWTCST